MSELIAFIKTFPAIVKLVQGFVDAWELARVTSINNRNDQRREERDAIIWAMEKAREARDVEKLRALNRQLAALDGNGVHPRL